MTIPIQKIREELQLTGAVHLRYIVGATSGIEEHTAREFVRHATYPRLYLIGRSKEQAQRITAEFAQLNPSATVRFIQSDISELRTVDKVCKQIQDEEKTKEGLDRKMALDFYSRLRFTENLLPQLRHAATTTTTSQNAQESPILARVISVLGGGSEKKIDTNDLSLKHNYTLGASTSHAVTMTSLSFERLAADPDNANVVFCHTSPGMLKTNGDRELPFLIRAFIAAFNTVCSPLTVSAQECGERHVRTAINPKFQGGKLYLVGPRSQEVAIEDSKVLTEMHKAGLVDVVGKHTKTVFEGIRDRDEGL
ncbi:hypothetical protein CEP53_013671 [Fusarium sp. AF-6]|nr:hypothetical protein CEP53_013671 [Fusarium sp. AF-6]